MSHNNFSIYMYRYYVNYIHFYIKYYKRASPVKCQINKYSCGFIIYIIDLFLFYFKYDSNLIYYRYNLLIEKILVNSTNYLTGKLANRRMLTNIFLSFVMIICFLYLFQTHI